MATMKRQAASRGVMLALPLGLLLAGVARVHAGDVYRWTDDKGVVHYSDTPPPTGTKKTERVRVDTNVTTPVADAAPAATAAADAAKNPSAAKPDAPPPAPIQDTPENRARLCEQSRAALELLQSKFQVADASGKALDEKTRAERVATAQQATSRFCAAGQ
jgi:hypothetical protein